MKKPELQPANVLSRTCEDRPTVTPLETEAKKGEGKSLKGGEKVASIGPFQNALVPPQDIRVKNVEKSKFLVSVNEMKVWGCAPPAHLKPNSDGLIDIRSLYSDSSSRLITPKPSQPNLFPTFPSAGNLHED